MCLEPSPADHDPSTDCPGSRAGSSNPAKSGFTQPSAKGVSRMIGLSGSARTAGWIVKANGSWIVVLVPQSGSRSVRA